MERLIVVATDDEYQLALNRFKDDKIIKTGVGGLNVIQTIKDIPKNTPILNFGYVGSNIIPVKTEITVNKCKLYHPNVEYDEPTYYLTEGDIICYTSNDFVLQTNIVEPCIFDMELAYILALGFENVTSIKIVSDTLNLDEYNKNIKNV